MISLAALAVAGGHSGIVHARTGPELSDLALFVVAGLGIWLVRRALRRRFAHRSRNKD
jgi:ABC-type nickel/cobalt efflux system permease component RcnA